MYLRGVPLRYHEGITSYFIHHYRAAIVRYIELNIFATSFCAMQDWYNDRVGAIYILHMNFFFWLIYTVGVLWLLH
jgi:hypothetical protein